jgi:hypothetical protein
VVQVARDDRERIRVQDGQQLLLGEAEQVLEVGGRGAQNSWFR